MSAEVITTISSALGVLVSLVAAFAWMIGRIDDRFDAVRAEVSDVRTEMADVRTEMAGVRTEMAGVRSDVAGLRSEVTEVKVGIARLEGRLDGRAEKQAIAGS